MSMANFKIKLLGLLLFCSNILFGDTLTEQLLRKQLNSLNKKQLEVLVKSYIVGDEKKIGLQLAVIAWKESFFGMYPMNIDDGMYGSYGVFHILLEYSMQRNNVVTSFYKSRLAERLVNDFYFSATEARDILLQFYDHTAGKDGRWARTFASYNGGYRGYNITASRRYGDDAMLRMNVLNRWMIDNKIREKVIQPVKKYMESRNIEISTPLVR